MSEQLSDGDKDEGLYLEPVSYMFGFTAGYVHCGRCDHHEAQFETLMKAGYNMWVALQEDFKS